MTKFSNFQKGLGLHPPGAQRGKAVCCHFLCLSFRRHRWKSHEGGQQDALNCELVRSLRIPSPPKPEQLKIVAFLEDEIDRAAAVGEKATSQIERLREYRQSLITAAVTGQLEIPSEDYE